MRSPEIHSRPFHDFHEFHRAQTFKVRSSFHRLRSFFFIVDMCAVIRGNVSTCMSQEQDIVKSR